MKNVFILFCIFLFVSSDSFAQGSWKVVIPANTSSSVYGIDASFVNDSVGYFASWFNGDVYKTTDKGETWNYNSWAGIDLRSIEFVNDTVGFIGRLSSSFGQPGAMYRTLNGGLIWSQLTNMQMGPDDGICGIEKFGNTVVATGTYSGPPWFYRSDDFGNSWSKLDLSTISSGLIDCYMYSSDTILATGVSANGFKANIIKSTDGGISWQEVFVASKPSTTCWKIFMRSSGKGIASIQSYITDTLKAAITNDYGDTWQEVNVAPPVGAWMAGVCFLNDTLGWISEEYNGTTYETQDGGLTWSPISIVNGVNRFVALDETTVIGPGSSVPGGVVFKYDTTTTTGLPYDNSIDIKNGYSLKVIPNPVNNNMTIEATSEVNTLGILRIVDLKGAVVMHVTKQFFKKGTTTLNQKIDLPAGSYYLMWLSNNMNMVEKFEVIK